MFKSKNPYKPFICLEGLQCDEIGKAYEEGQQNPDPKQYAKREELEKAVLDYLANNRYICFNHRVKWEDSEVNAELRELFRTHGLEE